MNTPYAKRAKERGVTSLFIVLFAALLLSIITVSFISMMVHEQQRSTDDEQSQSAYDAALSGVEDGKRVMAACRSGSTQACNAINRKQCPTVIDAGINGDPAHPEEVLLQSTVAGDGSQLNQAYTCVIVNTNAPDYIGHLRQHDDSIMVPLKAASNFTRIALAWHTTEDATTSSPVNSSPSLPPLNAWQANQPALLRVQLMQYSEGSIPATTSASTGFNSGTHARTIYLYPETVGVGASFGLDGRRTGTMQAQPVRCIDGGFSPMSGYSCEVTLDLPAPTMTDRTGFLRITSLYAGAHFQVRLLDSAGSVDFDDGVQTIVDSTGRANDLFRRVEARVEMVNESDFPYPRATVDITNNFCKTLAVSNGVNGYDPGSCDPTRAGN